MNAKQVLEKLEHCMIELDIYEIKRQSSFIGFFFFFTLLVAADLSMAMVLSLVSSI